MATTDPAVGTGAGKEGDARSAATFGELLAALQKLPDHELCELVSEVTVDRSHLRALHQVAQLSAMAAPVPQDAGELGSASISVAGGVVSPRDVTDGPVGEVPPLEDPAARGESGLEPGWTKDGVPTFSSVRDKIAARFAVAIGASETTVSEAEERSLEQQWEARARMARERLNQIRGLMQK
ncbi:hypothetical protein [Hoyosella altamirensis]|uniref:Uncharacterized protein n=1 Tax=Hoyosella altamirensis TaxID=616997 RepID=A0A839RRF9_9ACTN|nr:hypothetical protein [Hoyosella altamirensis]MBB3038686.1 hypothetical protein [Hoyosella altamirensis]